MIQDPFTLHSVCIYWTTDCTSLPVAQIQKQAYRQSTHCTQTEAKTCSNDLSAAISLQACRNTLSSCWGGLKALGSLITASHGKPTSPQPPYSPLFLKHSAHTECCHHSHCCCEHFSIPRKRAGFSLQPLNFWLLSHVQYGSIMTVSEILIVPPKEFPHESYISCNNCQLHCSSLLIWIMLNCVTLSTINPTLNWLKTNDFWVIVFLWITVSVNTFCWMDYGCVISPFKY